MRNALLLSLVLTLAACAPKSEVERLQAENAAQAKRIAELEQQGQKLAAALSEAAAEIRTSQEQLARKPAMPVQVNLRKAILGTGFVAVFSTTIKEDFPVLVTVKSQALGTSQQFRVNLSASGTTELGSQQGVSIEMADELVLENQNYSTATVRFKPK